MFISRRSNGIYYVWYEDDGGRKRKQSTGSRTKAGALQFLKGFEPASQPNPRTVCPLALSGFFSEYAEYSNSIHTPKSQASVATAFRVFIRIIGDVPIQSVGVREIENFLAVKAANGSQRSARTYFVTLASAFQTAVRWDYLKENPFRRVKKPRLPELQPAYLTPAEFTVLMRSMSEQLLADVATTGVLTGLRLSELLALRWEDVDLERRVILVRNSERFTTKSKRNRVIPMHSGLAHLLSRRSREGNGGMVFSLNGRPVRGEYISKHFKRAVRRAGLSDKIHFHSLRHTFASWLVQNGASLYEVQRLLGHSTAAMTQVYSHLQPEQLHSTVERLPISIS